MLSLIVFLLGLALPLATPPTAAATYDAMAVAVIDGLDDAQLANLAKQVGPRRGVTLEYSCAWSGLVVVKFADISTGERADVVTMARRLFDEAGITAKVDFVHIHIEPKGTGKC
ncbi:MAG: hypothetical protein KIT10_03395 [Flavobacteriales bacterium]|nr:hypothetical protein [Flavobacteriales bacterium]